MLQDRLRNFAADARATLDLGEGATLCQNAVPALRWRATECQDIARVGRSSLVGLRGRRDDRRAWRARFLGDLLLLGPKRLTPSTPLIRRVLELALAATLPIRQARTAAAALRHRGKARTTPSDFLQVAAPCDF